MAYHGYINLICQHASIFNHPKVLEIGVDKGQTMFPVVNALSRVCGSEGRDYLYTGIDVLLRDHVVISSAYINYANWNKEGVPDEKTAGLVDLRQGNSLDLLPQLIEQNFRYNIALIDGDHNYYTVKNELEYVSQLMVPKYGIIICDDYNGPGGTQDEYFSELEGFYQESERNENIDNLVKREDCDFGGKQGVKAAVDEFIENNEEWSLLNFEEKGEPVLLYRANFVGFNGNSMTYYSEEDNA